MSNKQKEQNLDKRSKALRENLRKRKAKAKDIKKTAKPAPNNEDE